MYLFSDATFFQWPDSLGKNFLRCWTREFILGNTSAKSHPSVSTIPQSEIAATAGQAANAQCSFVMCFDILPCEEML